MHTFMKRIQKLIEQKVIIVICGNNEDLQMFLS